ncbi:MAG: superoxide dismutase [Burkholderiales bacterium]|nr:superoxide dismutase [Burkholderiales bacterium]
MSFELPPLPYAYDALEPHISKRTMELHHDKHHKKYVDTLNKLVEGSPLARSPLEEVMRKTADDAAKRKLFNNAAQSWNHAFFWDCLSAKGGGAPEGLLGERIKSAFGSYDKFRTTFVNAATGQFGSGWVWLVQSGDRVEVVATANADNPLLHGKLPLLTCDVWEHAYYLDYQNRRAAFVEAFLDHLANWSFAAQQMRKKAA